MTKPNVLHLIDHTGPGGAQVVLQNIISELGDQFIFHIGVLGQSGEYSNIYAAMGATVTSFLARKWDFFAIWLIISLIREKRIEIVHCHLIKAITIGSIASMVAGCPCIIHDHSGFYPQNYQNFSFFPNQFSVIVYSWVYRILVRKAQKIIVLTPFDQTQYQKVYGIELQNLIVLPNGVKPNTHIGQARSIRQELGLDPKIRLIITAGRVEPEKDLITFIRVADRLQQDGIKNCIFLIIGDGTQLQVIMRTIAENGINNVLVLGYRKDVQDIMEQADIFISTSIRESFGLVILEAMLAGCAVISTNTSGPASVITDGRDGILVPVGNDQLIADCVEKFLSNPELCEVMAANAIEKVNKKYLLSNVINEIAGIYIQLLASTS